MDMHIYDEHRGLRHIEQSVMHMLPGIHEIPDSTDHDNNDHCVTRGDTKIDFCDM